MAFDGETKSHLREFQERLAERLRNASASPRVARLGMAIDERRRNQASIWEMLGEFARKHTKREMMGILNELNGPCGPIMSTEDLFTDEHVKGREMMVELDHPQRGKWYNVGMPIKLSASPAKIERSPTLGEHTDEVLTAVLGYDAQKIDALKTAGAFTAPPKKPK